MSGYLFPPACRQNFCRVLQSLTFLAHVFFQHSSFMASFRFMGAPGREVTLHFAVQATRFTSLMQIMNALHRSAHKKLLRHSLPAAQMQGPPLPPSHSDRLFPNKKQRLVRLKGEP
jgi:hypothetical protein